MHHALMIRMALAAGVLGALAGQIAPPAHADEPLFDDSTQQPGDRLPPLGFSYQDGAAAPPEAKPPTAGAESAAPGAEGASEDDDSTHLAKQLANPLANLISVPFQYNYAFGIGPRDAGLSVLNIQPVIPISIGEDWNVIVRTILPVINVESPAKGVSSEFGLGDTTQSFFFSPKAPLDGWILGAGPVGLWPTATSPELGCEQVALGPTAVALRQEDGWTYGMLVNQLWAVSTSNDHPRVNRTFLQPFFAYTWPTATTLTLNTESTYNWTESEWTVPVNLMLAQMVRFGRLPVQLQIGGTYYAVAPDDGPDWGVRFTITFLLPK